jgi:hypothetical protein
MLLIIKSRLNQYLVADFCDGTEQQSDLYFPRVLSLQSAYQVIFAKAPFRRGDTNFLTDL